MAVSGRCGYALYATQAGTDSIHLRELPVCSGVRGMPPSHPAPSEYDKYMTTREETEQGTRTGFHLEGPVGTQRQGWGNTLNTGRGWSANKIPIPTDL